MDETWRFGNVGLTTDSNLAHLYIKPNDPDVHIEANPPMGL